MAMAILGFKKLKSLSAIRGSSAHLARVQKTENADPRKLGSNRLLIGSPDPASDITGALKNAGITKVRKNGVWAMEIMYTASPEYFRPDEPERAGYWEEEKLEAWLEATVRHLREKFGDRLVHLSLHLDESTPHLTGYVVPLVKKKGRIRLSCRDEFGSPEQIRKFWTDFADAVRHLGLERGRIGSKAKNTATKSFYRAVNLPLAPLPADALADLMPKIPSWLKIPLSERVAIDPKEISKYGKECAEAGIRFMWSAHVQLNKKAAAHDLYRSGVKALASEEARLKELADLVRPLSLEKTAAVMGWVHDDKAGGYWSPAGLVSLSPHKGSRKRHIELNGEKIGYNSIDALRSVYGWTVRECVSSLAAKLDKKTAIAAAIESAQAQAAQATNEPPPDDSIGVPSVDEGHWKSVKTHFVEVLKFPGEVVERLHQTGRMWADRFCNVCFGLGHSGKQGVSVIGTMAGEKNRFRRIIGSAHPFFVNADTISGSQQVAFCENEIDAIALHAIHPSVSVVATRPGGSDGVVKDAALLSKDNRQLIAAFQANPFGEKLASWMRNITPNSLRWVPRGGICWRDQLSVYGLRKFDQRPIETKLQQEEVQETLTIGPGSPWSGPR